MEHDGARATQQARSQMVGMGAVPAANTEQTINSDKKMVNVNVFFILILSFLLST
jgi:hypothetical protein